MKTYLKTIQIAQVLLIDFSVAFLLIFPVLLAFFPEIIPQTLVLRLYDISHITVLLVMIIRPLADIFSGSKLIRPLVILRKGVGVLSASIIVSFIMAKLIVDPSGYLSNIGTLGYWSMNNFALLAHLGDISAIILLLTSNNYSKKVLGEWWKKVQKLAYVYFYAGSLYVFLAFEKNEIAYSLAAVTILVLVAYIKNRIVRNRIEDAKLDAIKI